MATGECAYMLEPVIATEFGNQDLSEFQVDAETTEPRGPEEQADDFEAAFAEGALSLVAALGRDRDDEDEDEDDSDYEFDDFDDEPASDDLDDDFDDDDDLDDGFDDSDDT
jgi:hypothetical protein